MLVKSSERRANDSGGLSAFGTGTDPRFKDTMSENPRVTALEELARAPIPTRFARFDLHVYRYDDPSAHPELSKEHCALVLGDLRGRTHVPVRVHSECLTSEVFGSLKCDCREQLERAQEEIARRGFGAILYLRQEGRGIGLSNKVRAYALQADGADTVAANEQLHLPVDARTYDVAALMLKALGVESIELLTNNPAKLSALTALGVRIERRVPVLVPATPFSASYLETKRRLMQHELPSNPQHHPPSGSAPAPDSQESLAS